MSNEQPRHVYGAAAKPRETDPALVPDGYMLVSAAVAALTQGMRGNFNRALPLAALKREEPRLSAKYGPWTEEAAARLRAAACEGDLPVYIAGQIPGAQETDAVHQVPPEALAAMIRAHQGLPDRPIAAERNRALRSTLNSHDAADLLAPMRAGRLVVSKAEFDSWYRKQRAKKQFPSQRRVREERPELPANGRPPAKARALRDPVLHCVNSGAWDAREASIAKLQRLIEAGGSERCSHDTLARVVDALAKNTGHPALQRNKKTRARSASD